jgi:hypothetical protein
VSTAATQGRALEAAIEAAEYYMDALKLAPSPKEKRKYDSKCKALIDIAERIKQVKEDRRLYGQQSGESRSTVPSTIPARAREPVSTRSLSNREQIIILENSKLNGSVFPPWSAAPELVEFEMDEAGELFTYVCDKIAQTGFSWGSESF